MATVQGIKGLTAVTASLSLELDGFVLCLSVDVCGEFEL